MKKLLLTTIAALGLLAGTNAYAQEAQEKDLSVELSNPNKTYGFLSNTVTNKNMFVGMNFGNDYMNQPYVEVGNNDFSFGTWANFDIKQNKAIEVDYYLNAKKNIELSKDVNLGLTGTLAYYTFPNTTFSDAKELKVDASLITPPANISLNAGKVFGDYGDSWHAGLKASKDLDMSFISDKLSASIDAELFYNNKYFSENSGLSHLREGANINYMLTPGTSVSLTGNIQQRLNDSFKDYVFNETYFSLSLNKEL